MDSPATIPPITGNSVSSRHEPADTTTVSPPCAPIACRNGMCVVRTEPVVRTLDRPGKGTRDDINLSRFLVNPSELFAVISPSGVFVWLSENWPRLLGWSIDEVLGRSMADFVHGDDLDGLGTAHTGLHEGDKQSPLIHRFRNGDGTYRWLEWSARTADGLIFATARDVTRRVEQDIRLRTRTRLLELGEDLAGLGHWVLSLPDYHLEWSPQVFRIHGLDPSSPTPTVEEALACYHPDDRTAVMAIVEHAIDTGEAYTFVKRLIIATGDVRFVSCAGRVDTDESGEVCSVYGVFRDVTDEIRAKSQLQQAKEAAEQASRAKSHFLASMSHELRTPLNAIIGFSEMIRDGVLGPISNPRYTDYSGDIHRSGTLLLNLVNDILDLSKIESGRFDLTPEDVDVIAVIYSAVSTLRLKSQDSEVEVRVDLKTTPLRAMTNPRALEQILINLLSNAVKYSDRRGRVTLSAAAVGDALTIVVKDQGCGIPADKIGIVTQPFERVDNRVDATHGGTGLGLAVVLGLVEAQGGTLCIDSTVDVGTEVTVRLPLRPAV